MIVDLSKPGIEKFILKKYQIWAMRHVWNRYADNEKPADSGSTWRYVNEILKEEKEKKSRASIIFFLDDKAEEGLLIKNTTTGKGGEKGLWTPNPEYPDEETFLKKMTDSAIEELKSGLY